MTVEEATELIRPAVQSSTGTWADIGAGTGMFTRALMNLLEGGTIYASDKSPHALWKLRSTGNIEIMVHEGDFNYPLRLPPLDGVIMANALHYARDHKAVLENVLGPLKPGGSFILIEYETDHAVPRWVPYPLRFAKFASLCSDVGLSDPVQIGTYPSRYGHEHIYAATATKPVD